MVLRRFSVTRVSTASLPPSAITIDSLPMFSPDSVGFASSRVPLPETPNSVPVQAGTDYTLNIAISNGPTPVPVPAAAPLMLGALGLLLGRTRRRRG